MTSSNDQAPILVTGAAGQVGSVGREVVRILRRDAIPVRALVHKLDARSDALSAMGADVVCADLTDLPGLHRALEGCRRVYFGMSMSPAYLEATINTAAVAREYDLEAFVNISQMTVAQMSVTETTDSPQQKLHWLSEQALAWSGLPVVTVRPTVFMEGLFLLLAGAGIRERDEIALPLGQSRTSPISAADVARAVAAILRDPAPHVGRAYNLTGPEAADLERYAEEFSRALGRTIRYRDVPLAAVVDRLRSMNLPDHAVRHISAMMILHQQGRYDRSTDDYTELTGRAAISVKDFARSNAAALSR